MPSRFLSPCFLLPLHSGHAVWSCGSWCPEFFMERGGREGGRSIGVSECSNRAYISSSLCPGQRVQQLHAVFSIPSPPPAPLSLFLPPLLPCLSCSLCLSLSILAFRLYFFSPLWNSIFLHVAGTQEGTLCV